MVPPHVVTALNLSLRYKSFETMEGLHLHKKCDQSLTLSHVVVTIHYSSDEVAVAVTDLYVINLLFMGFLSDM